MKAYVVTARSESLDPYVVGVYTTEKKAINKANEETETIIKGNLEERLEESRKYLESSTKDLDVLYRLAETEFPALLDKFVAREDMENTCDKIEKIIKEIDPDCYVQEPIDESELKGERAYGWTNGYKVHIYSDRHGLVCYSEVNDMADDINRHIGYVSEYKAEVAELEDKIKNLKITEYKDYGYLDSDWPIEYTYADITECEVE